MHIEISDEILAKGNWKEAELKLELALFLFQKNILTLEGAGKFAEVDTYRFQKALGANKIPLHYTQQDLEDDLRIVNEP